MRQEIDVEEKKAQAALTHLFQDLLIDCNANLAVNVIDKAEGRQVTFVAAEQGTSNIDSGEAHRLFGAHGLAERFHVEVRVVQRDDEEVEFRLRLGRLEEEVLALASRLVAQFGHHGVDGGHCGVFHSLVLDLQVGKGVENLFHARVLGSIRSDRRLVGEGERKRIFRRCRGSGLGRVRVVVFVAAVAALLLLFVVGFLLGLGLFGIALRGSLLVSKVLLDCNFGKRALRGGIGEHIDLVSDARLAEEVGGVFAACHLVVVPLAHARERVNGHQYAHVLRHGIESGVSSSCSVGIEGSPPCAFSEHGITDGVLQVAVAHADRGQQLQGGLVLVEQSCALGGDVDSCHGARGFVTVKVEIKKQMFCWMFQCLWTITLCARQRTATKRKAGGTKVTDSGMATTRCTVVCALR